MRLKWSAGYFGSWKSPVRDLGVRQCIQLLWSDFCQEVNVASNKRYRFWFQDIRVSGNL